MPLYEYECAECHRRTEKIQKFSDPELTTCPFCSGPLARTLTAPAIQFKGSGWYKDLYSSPKPAAASGSGEGTGGSSSGDAAPKSDSASKSDSTSNAAPASKPAATPSSTGASSS